LIGDISTLCFSAIRNQHANNQPPRISWTIHCIIGWNTRHLELTSHWIPEINPHIATSWRPHVATSWCPHIVVIMSDHIGPVIKKICDFNLKYYVALAIEAPEALVEHGSMTWIDPATPTKEIKVEDGSEIGVVEGL
jgi:hypothetical protein